MSNAATSYIVFNGSGAATGVGYTPDGTLPAGATACTTAQAAAWQYSTLVGGAIVAGAAPAPSAAQRAQAALGAGILVTSTATPAITGTYACDDSAQSRFSRMFNLIQRAGGAAFPAGLTELPWPDINGVVHVFTSVADFLNLETAVGVYVLMLDLIISTDAGTLPPATALIL